MTLLAAYNFDEGATDAIEDVTGNGHGFPLRTGMSRDPGHTATGLVSTVGTIEGPAVFGQTPQRTVMFWLKSTATFSGWIFEWHTSSGSTGYWGMLCLSNKLGFRAKASGGATSVAQVTRPADNAWHHWAGTFDGSVARCYLDGVLVATGAAISGLGTADILYWHDTVSGAQVVDDLRVYAEALDAATIADLMATPVTAGTAPEEHSGALDLSGAGSLFYVSTPSLTAERALSGTGALSLSGRPSFGGALGLSGSGSLSRAEEPHTAGALDLDGSGVLAASGSPATSGALDLDGSGSLASATSPSLAASLDLSGAGSLSTDGTPATSAPLALSGAGHLDLTGNGEQSTGGTLALSGTGSLALHGRPSVTASLPLDGVGALSRSGHPATSASLALAGAGTLRLSPATPTEVVDLTLSVSLDTARFVAALDADRFRAVSDSAPKLSATLSDGGWSASIAPNTWTGVVDA